MVEQLAALAHEQWSGWMDYVFQLSNQNSDSSVTIPADRVARWKRQIATPYAELSEAEKESDRIEARKMLAVFQGDSQSILEALRQAHEDTCSLHCPSVWRTGDSQPHSDKCKAISAVIAQATEALSEQ